jgi:hypothetical protein
MQYLSSRFRREQKAAPGAPGSPHALTKPLPASALAALRSGVDELRRHGHDDAPRALQSLLPYPHR